MANETGRLGSGAVRGPGSGGESTETAAALSGCGDPVPADLFFGGGGERGDAPFGLDPPVGLRRTGAGFENAGDDWLELATGQLGLEDRPGLGGKLIERVEHQQFPSLRIAEGDEPAGVGGGKSANGGDPHMPGTIGQLERQPAEFIGR
jgi:hypothetical protein